MKSQAFLTCAIDHSSRARQQSTRVRLDVRVRTDALGQRPNGQSGRLGAYHVKADKGNIYSHSRTSLQNMNSISQRHSEACILLKHFPASHVRLLPSWHFSLGGGETGS